MGSFQSLTISKFLGMNTSRDELSIIPGQLSCNRNYLYMPTGGLEERGGGALLSNAPSSGNPVFSLATYTNQNGTEYQITNQGTDAYYYSSGWNALSLSLTTSLKTRWAQSGKSTDTALYGVNGTDSVIKISGATPTGSQVGNSPTTGKYIKFHKNRLFIADDTTLYFTEVLDFDTWNTSANTIDIAPGVDGNITGLEIWGDALFIFKEHGVYVLPNADLPVPKINWTVLRADAVTGTLSPDSIKRTKVGIFYLSTDNFIRMIAPNISYSSGTYTLGGSGSPIVSEDIQDDLNLLLSTSAKDDVQAVLHKDLYIISFKSVNNSGSFNDLTYFADTSKFLSQPNIAQPQPFWGTFTGFDYDFFTQTQDNGEVKLYGAKGENGQVHETLNQSISNDNDNPIDSLAILGWYPIGNEATYSKINRIYFVGDTENWSINLVFNAYKYGELVPTQGSGSNYTSSIYGGGGIVGQAVVGTDIIGELSIGSTKFRANLRGNKFRAEMGNANANEFNRIHKIIFYYRPIHSH